MLNSSSLLLFAKTLAGKYSNADQAQKEPKSFAHINIYFRPLKWDILKGPWFYSEQSYDYAPWSPYRQGIHKLSKIKGIFVVENYALKEPERLAGSGFMPELLQNINKNSFFKRCGCAMHFSRIKPGQYIGEVEPGKKCLITKGGKSTYLVSTVEFTKSKWIGIDEGFDIKSNKKVWGSIDGKLEFKKTEQIGINLFEDWLEET